MRGKFLILILSVFLLSIAAVNAQEPNEENSAVINEEAVNADEVKPETAPAVEDTKETAVEEKEEAAKPVEEVKQETKGDKRPLAEYLDEKSRVGSATPLTIRELPVVKTIITREQIKRLGVR